MAASCTQFGRLQRACGDYAQAEPLFQRALAIREKILGLEHLDVAWTLHFLVELYCTEKKTEQAEPLCLRALTIREKNLGLNHALVAESLYYLGRCSLLQGKSAEAEARLQRALSIPEDPWELPDDRLPACPKEAPFEATVKELYRRPGEIGYQVKVSLKKNAAPGQFQESIFLKTNDPSSGLVPVLVRGNIQSPLEALPAALNLKEVKSGSTLTRRVLVRGQNPFKVVGIEGPGAVKLGAAPLPNLWQTVTLEIVPPEKEGPFHYEVKIKTDLQDAPVVVAIDGVVPKK